MRNRKMIAAAAMTAALAGGGVVGATLGNPLASGAQDGTTATTAPATTDATTTADPGGRPDGPMGRGPGGGFDRDAAAEALGITTDELQTQLEAGKTLAQVAEAQGVDKQTLIDALVAAGEAKLDEAKAALPERMAELVDSTLPSGGDHGGKGGPGGRGPGLDAAAEALGITADELRTELEAGKTIADVAEANGVDKQTVIDAMVAELKAHLDEEVASGEHTQEEADTKLADATERITTMVDEGMPAGGRGERSGN